MAFQGSKWLSRGSSSTTSSLLTHLGGYAAATPRSIVYASRSPSTHTASPKYQNSPSNTTSTRYGCSNSLCDSNASERWPTSRQALHRREQNSSYSLPRPVSSTRDPSTSQHFPASRHGSQHRSSNTPSAFTAFSPATRTNRRDNHRSSSLASTNTSLNEQERSKFNTSRDTLVSALETWLDAQSGEVQRRTNASSNTLGSSSFSAEENSRRDRETRLLSWLVENSRKPNVSSRQSGVYGIRSTKPQVSTAPPTSAASTAAPTPGILKSRPVASTTNQSYAERICAPADAWTALDDDYGPKAKKCGRRLTMDDKQSTFLEAHFRGLAIANGLSSNSNEFTFLNSIPNSEYQRRLQEGSSFYKTSYGDHMIFKNQKELSDCLQETEWSLAQLPDDSVIPSDTVRSILDTYSRSGGTARSLIKSTLPRSLRRLLAIAQRNGASA